MAERTQKRRMSRMTNPDGRTSGIDPATLVRVRRNLRRWYPRHARDLPWRRTRDPYAIWISEIMLQQTTVAAVIPYYERFLRQFPTIESLAKAPEAQVLRLWEGLGYYSRARNIHRMARQLVDEYDGEFPREVDALMRLPGIGRYTAGAIVSFAFDRPAPIVEANTLRLYSRLMGFAGDPRSTTGQRALWSFAEALVSQRSPGRFNQALMELGATVCRPVDPACHACPLRTCCVTAREGTQLLIPRRSTRVPPTRLTEAAVAIRKTDAYLLRRCGDDERWAGMWDFPRFELTETAGGTSSNRYAGKQSAFVCSQLRRMTGVEINDVRHVTTIRHSVTRFRIELLCLTASFVSGRLRRTSTDWKWVRIRDFDAYPLSVTARAFFRTFTEPPPERP